MPCFGGGALAFWWCLPRGERMEDRLSCARDIFGAFPRVCGSARAGSGRGGRDFARRMQHVAAGVSKTSMVFSRRRFCCVFFSLRCVLAVFAAQQEVEGLVFVHAQHHWWKGSISVQQRQCCERSGRPKYCARPAGSRCRPLQIKHAFFSAVFLKNATKSS